MKMNHYDTRATINLFKTAIIIMMPIFACNQTSKVNPSLSSGLSETRLEQKDSSLMMLSDSIKFIFGHRFAVAGDYDGDGKQEILREHFCSGINHEESNKFYDGITNQNQFIGLMLEKKPYSYLTADNKQMDTLHISKIPQHLGLLFLKNEGDLNNDGTDEIGYVVNWTDWSNLNRYHLFTYSKNGWVELYSFPIWEWQIPPFPEESTGAQLDSQEQNATQPQKLTKNDKFKSLVKKIGHNNIQVNFRNDEAIEDSMIIQLPKVY